jgi:aminomethyltransferase
MGQIALRPKSGALADAAAALERLIPMDVAGLAEGRQRYGLFTSDTGGILDDLMFANRGDHLFLVVNAARKAEDVAHLEAALGAGCEIEPLDGALLALQGPRAEAALSELHPDAASMRFMDVRAIDFHGVPAVVSRSGYTGEDGYEIALEARHAVDFAERLLAIDGVLPIGLGARDSLRLEAGLCLHGHDIDETTTPVEAGLNWIVGWSKTAFVGADELKKQKAEGAKRRLVGFEMTERGIARHGHAVVRDGAPVGHVTSGTQTPFLKKAVGMAYVPSGMATEGTPLDIDIRGRITKAVVTKLPFYKRTAPPVTRGL